VTAAVQDRILLYRAVGERELNDLLRFGDYGSSPNSFGKYFAFTLAGVQQFASAGINSSRRLTTTSIAIRASFLRHGFPFFDSGGAGWSIHFDEDVLPELYKAAGLPRILDAPWAAHIGKG
jgi:hypothetical protein